MGRKTLTKCNCCGTCAYACHTQAQQAITTPQELPPLSITPNAHSQLAQWPCRIELVPPNAPYFDGANLLIAADCTAFAYSAFHGDFMKNHITLICCPKLASDECAQKLAHIIKENNIKSIRIARMEVGCCDKLEDTARRAITESGKLVPYRVVTLSTDGKIL